MKSSYKLNFTSTFIQDMNEISSYIIHDLKNPDAAYRLVNDVQKAIQRRSLCADIFEPVHTRHVFQNSYYAIYIRNYIVFYVLLDDTMEVRRILYNGRNWIDIL